MRGSYFVFADYEIEDLAKECGVKEQDMESFYNFFSFPQSWIHILIEKFNDDRAMELTESSNQQERRKS